MVLARFYDCQELIQDLISRSSINFEPGGLGFDRRAVRDDWRISRAAFILATVKSRNQFNGTGTEIRRPTLKRWNENYTGFCISTFIITESKRDVKISQI